MAQETLGEMGGNVASVTYPFLGYTYVVYLLVGIEVLAVVYGGWSGLGGGGDWGKVPATVPVIMISSLVYHDLPPG